MKLAKKLISVLLVLAVIASLGITVSAADNYTITINNANDGHVYEAYQIFTGDLSGQTLSNIDWGNGITAEGQAALIALYAPDAKDAATVAEALVKKGNVTEFAEIAGAHLGAVAGTSTDAGDYYTITGLAAGYYLVKDQKAVTGHDAVTSYIIKVVADSTVTPKSSVPEVEKKVKDTNDTKNETTDWQDSADYDIGDKVPFLLTATLGNDLTGYDTYKVVFHDTLSAGLTFNNDVVVKIDGVALDSGKYTVSHKNGELTVTIDDVLANGAKAGSKITVEYTATLNEQAVIGPNGNPNEVYLEFSNNPNTDTETGTTPSDKVTVFTFELIVNKVDGEKNPLEGAGFTLYKKVGNEWVKVGEEVKGDQLTTFTWKGLDDGDYKLVETTVPAGYNKMKDIEFTITAEHEIVSEDPHLTSLTTTGLAMKGQEGVLTTDVVNHAGSTLPETGGMGTTLFYVIGSIMAMAAVVLLVTKKKMAN